jgi:hypothetical protein
MVRSTVAKYSQSRNNRGGCLLRRHFFLTDLPKLALKKRLGSETTLYGTGTLSFLSSRAKPRDLQFRGPLLKMRNTMLKQNCHLACRGTGLGKIFELGIRANLWYL